MRETIMRHFQSNYLGFYEKFIPEIKKVGRDEYKGKCCFHNDGNPSLTIKASTGLFHCHGCKAGGDMFQFYGLLKNLDTKIDFPGILKGISADFNIPWEAAKPNKANGKGWPDTWPDRKFNTATFDYVNEAGEYLSTALKFEEPGKKKTFRQGQRKTDGGYIPSIKDVRRVLYNLPALAKAQEALLLEGEKDTHTASKLGLTATTNPMGAGAWRPEYNESLRDKDVVLLPDNDTQGKNHMEDVAKSLQGIAGSIKLIELPDLPPGGDITDWVQTFDDKDEAAEKLAIMIEGTGPYEPPKKKAITDAVLEIGQFRALNLPARKKYLSPWLKEESISLISGYRGAGKTWFVISLLNAISNGESFGPWQCETSAPTLLLDGEMPTTDIVERMNALGLTSTPKNPFYIYSDAHANRMGLRRAHLVDEKFREIMKSILLEKGVKVWAIDNLASLASGLDENAKKDWDPINQWLLELRFAGISTIMLHHVNKDGGQRGTSGREDNIDSSILLKQPPNYQPEDGARFILHFTKARVAHNDLSQIAHQEFQLRDDDDGGYIWTHALTKKKNKIEILKMLDDGMTNTEIAEAVGVTKGRVSQIKAQVVKDGHLDGKNRLTQSGSMMVMDG